MLVLNDSTCYQKNKLDAFTMKFELQRILIAEACGFARVKRKGVCSGDGREWRWPEKGEWWKIISPSDELPDFLNDLNACHEMEKVLTMDQMRIYQDKLCWWVNHYIYKDQTRSGPAQHFDWVIHATAAQRAEAFLRTLNLWNE